MMRKIGHPRPPPLRIFNLEPLSIPKTVFSRAKWGVLTPPETLNVTTSGTSYMLPPSRPSPSPFSPFPGSPPPLPTPSFLGPLRTPEKHTWISKMKQEKLICLIISVPSRCSSPHTRSTIFTQNERLVQFPNKFPCCTLSSAKVYQEIVLHRAWLRQYWILLLSLITDTV